MNTDNTNIITDKLEAETTVPVRFSEVDSLRIVWHGHYVRYFEDAREAFGIKYDLRYLDVYDLGYVTPIVKVTCDYKKPLKYGDHALIKITYVDTPAAKLIFKYEIYRAENMELVATGETIQVFLDTNSELYIAVPDFLNAWKTKWGLK